METVFRQRKYQEPDFQIPGLVLNPILRVSDILEESEFGIADVLYLHNNAQVLYPQMDFVFLFLVAYKSKKEKLYERETQSERMV